MAREEMTAGPKLDHLTTKRFPAPIKFPLTSYSHCHDLLAIVTNTWEVSVFRITNGQLAYNIRQRTKDVEAEVTALSWKADGTCLGVGWSDGHYAIYDGGSGKQMQVVSLQSEGGEDDEWLLDLRVKESSKSTPSRPAFPQQAAPEPEPEPEAEDEPEKPEPPKVGCFGWMGHDTGRGARRKVVEDLTTDEWYDDLADEVESMSISKKTGDATLTDLPRAITTLDVTKVLPRLSAIPTHSTSSTKTFASMNKFGSQQATNNLFHDRSDNASNTIQSVLMCQGDGTVQVLLDETVKVGSSSVPGKPIMHAAHPQSPSHAILTDVEDSGLALHFLDLPLESLGGPLLHVIATNTKRIQTLLQYVIQTVRCIEHDFTTSVAFPQKMMTSVSAFLETEIESDPVLNLYHMAMTGSFNAPLLEWFMDVLKDRNQKTWDQTMSTMYTHIQNHIFVNLLPALDRFSIALTTLRGLANFYEGSSKFDCPAELFTNILEHIDSLRLVAQKVQLLIQTEHRQFRAFQKWIKMQLEIGVAGPNSNSAIEAEEREVPTLDYSLILPYIKDVMIRSRLTPHIETRPGIEENGNKEEFFQNPIIRDISYERSKEALERLHAVKSDAELKMKDVHDPLSLLNLPALTAGLAGHVRVALKRITEWQSRMLSRPTSISLPLDPGTSILDIAMSTPQQPPTQDSTTNLLALHPDTPTQLHILSISSPPPTTPSKRPSSQATTPPTCKLATYPFPPTGTLLDAKWIPHTNQTSFLTLFKSGEEEEPQTKLIKHTINPTAEKDSDSVVQQVFHQKGQFKPLKLVVGGRVGKLICVVIGNRGREWRVFDLDAGVKEVVVGGKKSAGKAVNIFDDGADEYMMVDMSGEWEA